MGHDIGRAVPAVLATAEPGERLEVFTRRVDSTVLTARPDGTSTCQRSDQWQIEVRSVRGGRFGAATTTVASADGVLRARDAARALWRLAAQPCVGHGELAELDHPSTPSNHDLDAVASAVRSEVDDVVVTVAQTNGSVSISDSDGRVGGYHRGEAQLNLRAAAPSPGGALGTALARTPANLDIPAAIGELRAARARLGGARGSVGAAEWVVLAPLASAQLLSHLANGFCLPGDGDGNRLVPGTSVAATTVSIVDDGTPSGGPAGIPFDDEGVPTRRTEVVSRGELRAQLGGLPLAVATGNARRAGWRHGLTVTPSNMYLVPDGPDRVDLGALCGDGVYVEQISGVRRRVVDLTTTRLQLTLRGAAVHRGETVGPVQGLLGLTGVSLLSAVRAVRGATRFYRVNGVFGGSECVLDGIDVAFA